MSSAVVFPLSQEATNTFKTLKNELINVSMQPIDENTPFTVETDASDIALSGTLSQNGKPVAFFSRTFSDSEKRLHSVEKEALAIVETIRKWHHLLASSHFTIITNQRSVSYLFKTEHCNKIKNEKLARWRLELSIFDYDVVYRPGSLNKSADALSRAYSATSFASHPDKLRKLHVDLFHPGVERLTHFIKQKNLPYSVNDVKTCFLSVTNVLVSNLVFFNAKTDNHLIKALHPMDRLVCDFKGPVKSTTRNRFLFVVVVEYSRFTWAFPCSSIDTKIVYTSIFSVFGMPNYVHNDQGRSLISSELKEFLHGHGIATSQTTRFNPRGNSQCERFNGILWQSIIATLRSLKLHDSQWETVLQEALHAQRSLTCTATNCTPHERMFTFPHKSSSGCSIPSWLKPGPA